MKKLIVSAIVSMFVFSAVNVFAQDASTPQGFDQSVRAIKTICADYYQRNEDCPFDNIIGVPLMESRSTRFDSTVVDEVKPVEEKSTEEVKKEVNVFRSN